MPFLIALLLAASPRAAAADFVSASSAGFVLDGRPYRFLGTNLWYAMNLGSTGPGGDRERLSRELDRLKALGVDNLRLLGLSEGPDSEPWRIAPAVQREPGRLDERLLEGLDFVLAEMGRRGQRAVIVLDNFWPWSGGMAQYLAWGKRGPIPYPPPAPGGDWSRYQDFTAAFFADKAARSWERSAVKALLTRRNSLTKKPYRDDPAIMAWELANEPRGRGEADAFNAWISEASRFIKSLDPNHLVTAGCEGDTPWPKDNGMDFSRNHAPASVDYATIHIWAQNWGWYDPARAKETYPSALDKMRAYMLSHAERAKALGKPLVIEEFGLARDSASYEPAAPTAGRDDYYAEVFGEALRLSSEGYPLAGVNFWAWSGEGRPRAPGAPWKRGDAWLGDPPHEVQGWYGVYDRDDATLAVIASFAKRFSPGAAPARPPGAAEALSRPRP